MLMHMKKISKILGICIIAAIIIIIFIGSNSQTEFPAKRLGFVLPVTGDTATYGEAAQNAAKLAIEDLEKNGIKINPIYEDNGGSGTVAAGLVQKFLGAGDVAAVVSFGSGDALAICPLIKDKDMLLFNSGSSPKTTDCEQTYRNYPSDMYQGKVLADKAKELGYKKVALIYLNNDYGVGLKTEFLKHYKEFVVIEEVQTPGSADFRTQISKIKASGAEQIVLISQLAEAIPFLNQYVDQGMTFPILASESIKDESLLGKIPTSIHAKISAIAASEYQGPEANVFKTRYKEKYGTEPAAFADYVYDNTIVAGKAINACRTTKKLRADCMEEFIQKYKETGATGNILFGANGDIVGKSYDTFVIKGGKFVKEKN